MPNPLNTVMQAMGELPIDRKRPIIENDDGTFSTERTITIQDPLTGKWVNIPTIVGGKQQDEATAEDLYNSGTNMPTGRFNTLPEAEANAVIRSQKLGTERDVDRLKSWDHSGTGFDKFIMRLMGIK